MPYLADSNLLLRGAEPGHPMQAEAEAAVAALLGRGEQLYIAPQNLYEFWVVATRPLERNGLGMTAIQAEAELARIEAQFPLLPDTPAVYQEWRRLVMAHAVLGVRAHDSRLVASMLVHGVTHMLTFNVQDFSRYPEITVVHRRAPPERALRGTASLAEAARRREIALPGNRPTDRSQSEEQMM
jgi:predicted nucleic acid-binding protein